MYVCVWLRNFPSAAREEYKSHKYCGGKGSVSVICIEAIVCSIPQPRVLYMYLCFICRKIQANFKNAPFENRSRQS